MREMREKGTNRLARKDKEKCLKQITKLQKMAGKESELSAQENK